MDFARKQLEKYGWTDGKGLGKYENGISQALKPKLKRSVAGVGHDAASDFTEHWWTALYDKATGNVQVEEQNGKTKKIKTKDKQFKITNSTWKLRKKANNEDEEYSDYFVKKAVLSNGGSKLEKVRDSESDDEEIVKKEVTKMTDEELFAACEGRTAHKGARHGLKALGKLARIERQEQMLLKEPQYKGYSHAKKLKQELSTNDMQVVEDISLNDDVNLSEVKKKKKKRRRCSNDHKKPNVAADDDDKTRKNYQIQELGDNEVVDDSIGISELNEHDGVKKKSKKSKKRHLDCNKVVEDLSAAKKKNDQLVDVVLDAEIDDHEFTSKKSAKCKKTKMK